MATNKDYIKIKDIDNKEITIKKKWINYFLIDNENNKKGYIKLKIPVSQDTIWTLAPSSNIVGIDGEEE